MTKTLFKTSTLPLLISTVLASSYVSAETDEFSEEDFLVEIPEVVTATNMAQKLTEAPAAITIIDRDIIEASGALNIPDLFRLVPGMQVYHVSTNKMGVTYHGMSDDFPGRMEVMINGRSIYIPLLTTVVWEAIGITVDDIDHIEVVRGSNVPTHGSNAFLGAINIITKAPVSESGTSIKTTLGALGTENFTARHSGSSPELQYTLSAGSLKNDGIDLYGDGGHSKHLNFSGSLTPNLTDTIHFDIGLTEGYASRGDGDKTDPVQANFSPRDHKSNYQDIRWNQILNNQAELQLRYTHNYLKLDTENFTVEELAAYESLPLAVAAALLTANNGIAPEDNERGTVDTHELGVLYTTSPNDKINAVIGSDFRYERAKSDVLLQNADNDWVDETSWQLFGNLEYKVTDRTTLNAGAMFEESSIIGGETSFRTALNYALTELSILRTAYSHTHRMPSLLEANSSYTVNLLGPVDIYTAPFRDMKPEEINSIEVGYFQLWPELSSQIDIRVFYEDINNALLRGKKIAAADADGDLDISDNNAAWTNQGFEAQLKFKSPAAHQSSVLFNYSYNNTKGDWNRGYYPPVTDTIVQLDTRSPMHTASILLSTKPTSNSLVSLAHYYMSHVEWLEGYSDNPATYRGYTRTDLKLSKTYQLDNSSELEAAVIVQNLFDKEYIEFYANNIFERRTYLQLGLTF